MDTMVSTELMSVRSFAEKHSAFSEQSLRNWIRRADTNGLKECGAVLRMGAKVMIDERRFLEHIYRLNGVATPEEEYENLV